MQTSQGNRLAVFNDTFVNLPMLDLACLSFGHRSILHHRRRACYHAFAVWGIRWKDMVPRGSRSDYILTVWFADVVWGVVWCGRISRPSSIAIALTISLLHIVAHCCAMYHCCRRDRGKHLSFEMGSLISSGLD
jgi:hypothetical protein